MHVLLLLVLLACIAPIASQTHKVDTCESFKMDETVTIMNFTMKEHELTPNFDSHICKGFALPLDKTLHAIRFDPIIIPHGYVHHMSLHFCEKDEVLTDIGQQTDCLETGPICKGQVYVWTPEGNNPLCMPEAAGYRIGKPAPFMVLRIHYKANNRGAFGTLDNSGVSIYTTTNLRQYDAGTLITGAGDSLIHLEPNTETTVDTSCPASCSSELMPESGIQVFAAMSMAHELATELESTISRSETQLMHLESATRNLDERHQVRFSPPTHIELGDTFATTCKYNTSGALNVVTGGPGASMEECLTYYSYYPKMEHRTCLVTSNKNPAIRDGRGTVECGYKNVDMNEDIVLVPCGPHDMKGHVQTGLDLLSTVCTDRHSCSSDCFARMLTWLQADCTVAVGFTKLLELCNSATEFPTETCAEFFTQLRYCRGLCIVGQEDKDYCVEGPQEKDVFGFTGKCIAYECEVSYLSDTIRDLNAHNLAHVTLVVSMLAAGVFITIGSVALLIFDICS